MAMYDNKPSMYEANNNGSYTYRWDIKEVQVSSGMRIETDAATTTKWECKEVIVWGTVTKEKLTETVVADLWANDYEKKLINDYSAAKEGVFGSMSGSIAQEYISRYKNFLAERKDIKGQIEADCIILGIMTMHSTVTANTLVPAAPEIIAERQAVQAIATHESTRQARQQRYDSEATTSLYWNWQESGAKADKAKWLEAKEAVRQELPYATEAEQHEKGGEV